MSAPMISIRLALFTDLGPCGGRLERVLPLPTYEFSFEDSAAGRERAELARRQLQAYVDKYHVSKHGKRL